tara:strand:- start:911 stop:2212 length:1302 start_codon:yes stop_codon:yes gene_type:complete
MSEKTIFVNRYTKATPEGQIPMWEVSIYEGGSQISSKHTNKQAEAEQFYRDAEEQYPNAGIKLRSDPTESREEALADPPLPPQNQLTDELADAQQEEVHPSFTSPADGVKPPGLSNTPNLKSPSLEKPAVNRQFSPGGKAVDESPIEEQIAHGVSGIGGQKRKQAVINYNAAECETVFSNSGNAKLILGADRNGDKLSGYGMEGHTQSDAIYLCAGMGGHRPKQVDAKGNRFWTNPNFFVDAAFIYISQKTDCDVNFAIGTEENREVANAKSAVVLKGDNIRVVGRETLKLVTKTDVSNSQGGKDMSTGGVEIIANNHEDSLQPMVLGDNLVNALKKINNFMNNMLRLQKMQMDHQQAMNRALTTHTHRSPLFAKPTLPSEVVVQSGVVEQIKTVVNTERAILTEMTNLAGLENNYSDPQGPEYILSAYNKVN